MKFLILTISSLFILTSCTTAKPKFENKNVCFLLFNLSSEKFEEVTNQEQCEVKLQAASTFKIPLAVMAFDAGVLKDENSMLKWDGTKRMLDVWNKDHTASSWMKESVVWFSQELTPKIGKAKIENYLQNFEYGNADMSGGIKVSWLSPNATLKISGFEQIHFLKKLWRGELKASPDAQLKTISLLAHETSPLGYRLLGKTGSGRTGADNDLRIGWWVGYLETKKENYVVVVNFTDKQKINEQSFGGPEARELAKQLLAEKKLW